MINKFFPTPEAALAELPDGAIVGTGAVRRIAQLNALRLPLSVTPIRGNVDTRIGRVLGPSADLHAVVLARAGLVRARRESRSMLYSADLDGFRALVAFLTRDCCCGRPEICAPILESLSADALPGA